jgi:transposase
MIFMSSYDYIKDSLGIKDSEKINFMGAPICIRKDGKTYSTYYAKLIQKTTHCAYCNTVKDGNNIIIHTHTTSKIKLPPNGKKIPIILMLKKPRFLCKTCNKTFQLENSIVKPHNQISNQLKFNIFTDASFLMSESTIAHQNHVSHSTVNRIINDVANERRINYNWLPEVLCFDELKSTNDAEGAMSFGYLDHETGKLIDMLESRTLDYLLLHFQRYQRNVRRRVKYIVIDMYEPYVQLIKRMFPWATIVTDKFHIVQLVNRALNQTRIAAMKRHKEQHTKFKRYWKLILMDSSKLKSRSFRWCPSFRKYMTTQGIVKNIINYDAELKATYDYYQKILMAITNKDTELLKYLLDNPYESISDKMKTARKTLKKFIESVTAALETSYTNAPLEGTITLIKAIKRMAFGYRSFYHFRNRVMLILDYNPIKKQRLLKQKRKQEAQIRLEKKQNELKIAA